MKLLGKSTEESEGVRQRKGGWSRLGSGQQSVTDNNIEEVLAIIKHSPD